MKIAYITTLNPYNKHSWSGTNYYVRESLEKQGHDVYCIYGVHTRNLWQKIKYRMMGLLGKVWLPERTIAYSKKYAKKIEKQIQPGTDVILSLETIPIAFLNTNIPVYVYVDDIFEHFRTYYGLGNITDSIIKEANIIEQSAIDNCHKVITCSNVTASAISEHYRIDKDKLEVVPLGANIDIYPSEKEVKEHIAQRSRDKCRILFVGVEWLRKGADIVLETTEILVRRGISLELHLCGIRDLDIELPDFVVNHGFINKSTQAGIDKLYELYSTSHFLFVPSRAESYGLVFCEASAFGVPSISHRTGGLLTVVKDGVNGQLFDVGTAADIFADYIIQQFDDYESYINLAESSYKRFLQELNWDVAGRRLTMIMQNSSR